MSIPQEKDVKQFREGLKQELKLLKQEVDMLPKDQRKDALRRKKEEKEIEQAEKVGIRMVFWWKQCSAVITQSFFSEILAMDTL